MDVKHNVKLSIIVPVYCVEKYIEKCISSLLVDGCDDYEIVVVNDGTKDRSIDIIREKFNDARIRIINQENGGLSAARNHGIAEAKGEYIWFVDSDDWVETEEIVNMIAEIKGVDMLFFKSFFRNTDTEEKVITLSGNPITGMDLACQSTPHQAQFYIVRKAILIDNNWLFTEGILHEDSLFTPIMKTLCGPIKAYSKPVYHHYQRRGSITQSVSPKRLTDLMFVITELNKYAETKLPIKRKYEWGTVIAELTNELLFVTLQCNDNEARESVKEFVNHTKYLLNYLKHSSRNNRIMQTLAVLSGGNLYGVYNVLHKLRYNSINRMN